MNPLLATVGTVAGEVAEVWVVVEEGEGTVVVVVGEADKVPIHTTIAPAVAVVQPEGGGPPKDLAVEEEEEEEAVGAEPWNVSADKPLIKWAIRSMVRHRGEQTKGAVHILENHRLPYGGPR